MDRPNIIPLHRGIAPDWAPRHIVIGAIPSARATHASHRTARRRFGHKVSVAIARLRAGRMWMEPELTWAEIALCAGLTIAFWTFLFALDAGLLS